MKLIILGTGTSTIVSGKACCAYFIKTNDGGIGIDFGPGILLRYVDAGLDYMSLDTLFITHCMHPDHVNDLPMLLFSMNYTLGRTRTLPLNIYGPPGLKEYVDIIFKIYPKARPKTYPLNIVQVNDFGDEIAGLHVKCLPVNHGEIPTIGVRLQNGDRSLCISSDTAECENLRILSQDVDMLVLHCAVADGYIDAKTHLNGRSAGRVAFNSHAKKIIITHRYPIGSDNEVISQIRETYSGLVHIAKDFDEFLI